jgi:hypothetical protein
MYGKRYRVDGINSVRPYTVYRLPYRIADGMNGIETSLTHYSRYGFIIASESKEINKLCRVIHSNECGLSEHLRVQGELLFGFQDRNQNGIF